MRETCRFTDEEEAISVVISLADRWCCLCHYRLHCLALRLNAQSEYDAEEWFVWLQSMIIHAGYLGILQCPYACVSVTFKMHCTGDIWTRYHASVVGKLPTVSLGMWIAHCFFRPLIKCLCVGRDCLRLCHGLPPSCQLTYVMLSLLVLKIVWHLLHPFARMGGALGWPGPDWGSQSIFQSFIWCQCHHSVVNWNNCREKSEWLACRKACVYTAYSFLVLLLFSTTVHHTCGTAVEMLGWKVHLCNWFRISLAADWRTSLSVWSLHQLCTDGLENVFLNGTLSLGLILIRINRWHWPWPTQKNAQHFDQICLVAVQYFRNLIMCRPAAFALPFHHRSTPPVPTGPFIIGFVHFSIGLLGNKGLMPLLPRQQDQLANELWCSPLGAAVCWWTSAGACVCVCVCVCGGRWW